jgi:hypothetical protein
MSLFSEMESAISEVQRALPKTCIIKGITYNCLVGEPLEAETLQDGGYLTTVLTPLKILRKDLINNIPRIGTTVEQANKRYEISAIADRPEHPQVVMNLVAKND